MTRRLSTPPPEWSESPTFRFLHVSNFSPAKRLDLIIGAFYEVWQTHPDVSLTIAGDGDIAQLTELIASLAPEHPSSNGHQPEINVSGPHSLTEIADLMRAADAFLLTSDYETQSVVMLEAQLCGLKTIATQCGGPESIVTDSEQGELIDVDDYAALLNAMQKMVHDGRDNPVRRADLSTRAKKLYAASAIRQQLLLIYDQATRA